MSKRMATRNPPASAAHKPQPLVEFLHASSPDAATRTMAAAMLALTQWQIVGLVWAPTPPSMLLVNVGGEQADPLDAIAAEHSIGNSSMDGKERGEGLYAGGSPDRAKTAMLCALGMRNSYGPLGDWNSYLIRQEANVFNEARAAGYGSGRIGRYARRWEPEFGWITDADNSIILRLDQPEDRVAFRQDVLKRTSRLLAPRGLDERLDLVTKTLTISGSLTPTDWDRELSLGVVRMGLPMFFLPHHGGEPLSVPTPLKLLSRRPKTTATRPITPSIHLAGKNWLPRYEKLLRQRLRELPGAYEFSVLDAVHRLGEVCSRIARIAAAPDSSDNEVSAMYMDLHAMAFRGIIVGIASLAYHGLGFDAGCPKDEVTELLQHLRENGPLSRRDLQRKFHTSAQHRDQVIGRLAAEGLVKADRSNVEAVPLADFIQSIHARPEFVEPEYLCPVLLASACE